MSENPFDFSDFRGGAPGGAGGPASPGAGPGRGAPAAGPSGYGPPVAGFPPGGVDRSAAGSEMAVARPPLRLLGIALALAVVGGVLGAVALLASGAPALAVAGWVLAGPAAFAMLGAFTTTDTRQRARSVYVAPVWSRTAYWTAAVVALAAVVVTAIALAEWVGRL